MTSFLIGIFIAAARAAAVWPQPHRRLAQAALKSLPPECFEDDLAEAIREWRLSDEIEQLRWN